MVFVFQTELEISEIYSRLLNKAYSTLKDPSMRGFYLLDLQKLPVDDSFLIEKEFLMSVMEKNEELESINNTNSLQKFMNDNKEIIDKQIHLISNSFYSNNWKEARINLLKLNYFISLESKIKAKKTELDLFKN